MSWIEVTEKEATYVFRSKNFSDQHDFGPEDYHDSVNAIHTDRDLTKVNEPTHSEDLYDWIDVLRDYNNLN